MSILTEKIHFYKSSEKASWSNLTLFGRQDGEILADRAVYKAIKPFCRRAGLEAEPLSRFLPYVTVPPTGTLFTNSYIIEVGGEEGP